MVLGVELVEGGKDLFGDLVKDTVPVELPCGDKFGNGLCRFEGLLRLLAVIALGEDADAEVLEA